MDQILRWAAIARSRKLSLDAVIHLDSGMNRIGLGSDQAAELGSRFDPITMGLNVKFFMSHLATVKGDDHSMSFRQLEKLKQGLSLLPERPVSFSCTDGVILLPNEFFNFDIVRIGVGLLGGAPNSRNVLSGTEPMIEVYVKYSQVKWVETGETIGYGGAYTAKRRTRIALAHIGYKDGYLRTLSHTDSVASGAWMAIGGHIAPVIGKVSLGLTTLDVTDVPDAVLETFFYAEVLGPIVNARAIADITGCYEVIASLGRSNVKVADYTLDQFELAVAKDANLR
jgi:alanine racemase